MLVLQLSQSLAPATFHNLLSPTWFPAQVHLSAAVPHVEILMTQPGKETEIISRRLFHHSKILEVLQHFTEGAWK